MANKLILAWILKCCVPEFENSEVTEIAARCITGETQISQIPVLPDEPVPTDSTKKAVFTKHQLSSSAKALFDAPKLQGTGIEDVTITEGTVTFDIRFQAFVPGPQERAVSMIVNIEAQNKFYPGYPLTKRGIYYCSRMISSQHGTVFTNSHYEKLKKVYSIWICTNPPMQRTNTVSVYSVAENNLVGNFREKRKNYDLLTMILICLGNPYKTGKQKNKSDSILRLLDVLLASEITPKTKFDILEREFSIPMTQKMKGDIRQMCNVSDGIEWKGIKKGIKKGIRKGRREGRREGRRDAIQSLMRNMKLTTEQAMDALSIPMSERAMYERMLKH